MWFDVACRRQMMAIHRRAWPSFVTCVSALIVLCSVRLTSGQIDGGSKAIPPLSYYVARAELYDGDYRHALRDFQGERRSAIKTPQSSWIDSICYDAMIGETYYHMGRYSEALKQYDSALKLFSAFSDWMIRVQYTGAIRPDASAMRQPIPWHSGAPQATVGHFAGSYPIGQGRINNNDVIRQGGVVQQAVLFPINVHEIVRCTSLALRRRRELMGPVTQHDPFSAELASKLARRPGPPNHWSEAWIDVQLGLAYAGMDDMNRARQFLQRSLLAAGEYQHPLTCVALLELGRYAMESGDFATAAGLFEQASYSAVYFDDFGVVEEAFRLGQQNHLLSNKPGVFPPLAAAKDWARAKRFRQFEAWLSVLMAENLAVLGQPNPAAQALTDARNAMLRSDMADGIVGVQFNYVMALVNYQRNQPLPAAESLALALTGQRRGASKWLMRIALVDGLYAGEAITPRVATQLYSELLRDPKAADWRYGPLEALSVLVVPHSRSYELWFDATLRRKEIDVAIEVADAARRHRFFASLPLGGRLLTLRRTLEAPLEELNEQAALERKDLLVRFPKYDQLAGQAKELYREMAVGPLLPPDDARRLEQQERLESLAQLHTLQEGMLHEMALRREPAAILFPPLRKTPDLQAKLPERRLMLVFFAAGGELHAFLISDEKYAHWEIRSPAALQKSVAALLRELGNFDGNREQTLSVLQGTNWRTAAAEVLKHLLDGSEVNLAKGIDELVIVPDGFLWYLPFEALPIGADADAPPMVLNYQVRYAPTAGLAVADSSEHEPARKVGVVSGRLFPRDDDAVAQAAFEEFRRSVPTAERIPAPLPPPAVLLTSRLDGLVVLDDLAVDAKVPFAWSFSGTSRGKPDGTLADWLGLPWSGPREVILPGFHTAAENSLKQGSPSGHEIFLAATSMMSKGAHTILLSRWRVGGQTAFDLVREFAQELPFTSASDAWQRSVELTMERPLNWELEPRLKRFEADPANPARATHPFFWSGYLLVDQGTTPRQDAPEAKPAGAELEPLAKPEPVLKFKHARRP